MTQNNTKMVKNNTKMVKHNTKTRGAAFGGALWALPRPEFLVLILFFTILVLFWVTLGLFWGHPAGLFGTGGSVCFAILA